jgi:type IV pilus assembly protein PilB
VTRKSRLGDVLKRFGSVSESDLNLVIEEQQKQQDHAVPLGELMLRKGLVSKKELGAALQEVTRVTFVDCLSAKVDRQSVKLISRDAALRYCCLPIALQGRVLVVVMAEPQNLQFRDDLRFITGLDISPRLGFRDDIGAAIDTYLPESNEPPEQDEESFTAVPMTDLPEMEFFTASSHQRAREAIREFQAEMRSQPTAAVRLVSQMIATGENKKASDIHIEPQATETQIRMRVDGILREMMQVSQALSTHLVSRIKILADLDIAERRIPQDGRFLVRIGEKKFDLRVSTLPTHYGEKVVIRLLDPDATRVSFADLGFPQDVSAAFGRVLNLPQGLILVCGPTGSGKTTTLYAALNHVSTRAVNIVTVEDPIEYMLKGINQVQVNFKAGLNFASYLRSILRQDPNIIMVGEIRDKETAEIALTSAQTGHLILSTLHTNDSIAALDRLRDLGVPSFLIASSVSAVISQRLLRRLCGCRIEGKVSAAYAVRLREAGIVEPMESTHAPVGCEACDNTGYKGRIGVFEQLTVDDEIRSLLQNEGKADDLRDAAATCGMRFLSDVAIEKARQGLTSLDEVFRVVPFRDHSSAACSNCGRHLVTGFLFCPSCGARIHNVRERANTLPWKGE